MVAGDAPAAFNVLVKKALRAPLKSPRKRAAPVSSIAFKLYVKTRTAVFINFSACFPIAFTADLRLAQAFLSAFLLQA